MSLEELDLPPLLDTSNSDLIADFFIPALGKSEKYDRGVGFFSSGWLQISAKGMAIFAENGGKARWVTSPILSREDWNALQTGDEARTNPVLRAALERNIDNLKETLEKDTLSALAWMVADNILDFKIALPRNKLDQGDFHDKFGIFTDSEGNQISFNGSYNDSIQGTRNYESIKIFTSWNPALSSLVISDASRFERLWNNQDPNVQVFNLPAAARDKIFRQRNSTRPYPHPIINSFIHSIESPLPEIPPHITLREYQSGALAVWFENQCRGVLEMATGTGKTITALAAAVSLFKEKKRLILVISCPYKHLVEQWATESLQFGFRPIKVVESRQQWGPDVSNLIRGFRKEHNDLVTIITTNSSFSKTLLPVILEKTWSETLLIADEVHHMGAPKLLSSLPERVPWRLGLSATPIRYYDAEGTDAILDYFGDVVYQFGLKEAIGSYLTPYYYHPIPVEMTADEFDEFCNLTIKLAKFYTKMDEPMSEAAQRIAIKRARVLNNSLSKIDWLRNNIENYSKMKYTLFYVGEFIFDEVRELLGIEKRIRIHEFTESQNNKERKEILDQFAAGDLQALIAKKCLDEGVDVPPTRTAYFLASSGNPREFVQRRGRVLRKAVGKKNAILFDLVSIPPMEFIEAGKQHPNYGAVRAAVRREYRRIKEFSELAENKYQALDSMFEIAEKLNLLDV